VTGIVADEPSAPVLVEFVLFVPVPVWGVETDGVGVGVAGVLVVTTGEDGVGDGLLLVLCCNVYTAPMIIATKTIPTTKKDTTDPP